MKENKANKKGRKLLWGTVIITMILSFMFFYVLYCSNNKYMTREEKAIHGLLYADGSYESFPVYYLSREWEYYPDALLTPEDDLDKYYFRYISIGEYGGMELGNSGRSPYGSGTYRLKIMLPAVCGWCSGRTDGKSGPGLLCGTDSEQIVYLQGQYFIRNSDCSDR